MVRAPVLWAVALWLFTGACGQRAPTASDASADTGGGLGGTRDTYPASDAGVDTWPVRSGPYERCGGAEAYFYVDADGDGAGTGDAIKLPCDNGLAPLWYSWSNTDCDDSDPTKRRLYNRDADGDGVGAKDDTICAGREAPPGYVVEPDRSRGDCDDSNPEISYPYHLDADGDGVPAPNAPIVCGPPGQPPPNAAYPFCGDDPRPCDDCDDANPTIRTLYYQDLDGDGYAASTEVSICGSPDVVPLGFGTYSVGLADCDDSRPDVSPDALDQWTDGVDADCDGRLAPVPGIYSCSASVETCDPAWFATVIDSTCDSSDLSIGVDVYTLCGESTWMVWIGNRGMTRVSEYTLTIESSDPTIVFHIRDPLPAGAQYPYGLPVGLRLSGTVRFSVTMASPDCNPGNNTVTEFTDYGACPV